MSDGACSRPAWHLHQAFKREVVARLPEDGGRIPFAEVVAWIDAHWPSPAPINASDDDENV